ncbi:MAG: ABC transporter substrate-binding protein [Cardiobacteriaceae bacterium]|nr:ABC transporter substrate-binding protein [Cardiobacteriaceae bacterium]
MKKTLLAALFLSAHVHAADKLNVVLDWFVNPDHAALIVAQQKGYFAAHDLDVTLEEPSDPSVPPKLVAAGKADLAVSYQPELYIQNDAGLGLVRTATLVATPLNTLIVSEKSDIKTIADLKGKTIGYSVAGVEEALLTAILKTGGLTLDDVKRVNVNFSLAPAVMTGQVDAVIGGYRNFELHQMQTAGQPGRAFFIEEHGVPAYDELIVIAHKDRLNADLLARFNQALEEATQYTINHPEDAWQAFIGYRKDLDDDTNRAAWGETLPRLAHRPGALDTRRYERFAAFMHGHGLIKTLPTLADYAIQP